MRLLTLERRKMVRNYDQTDVMSCCKKLSADWTRASIIFSLRLCVVRVTGPDTIVASEDYLGVRIEGNPPCNAEDNLRAGHIVIEAWFRGYRGSLGLRGPWASGLLDMGRTDGP